MLQLHAQLTLIRALPCAAAMLLDTFGRRIATLLFCPLHGLGLRDRARSSGFSPSALFTICTLGGAFFLPLSCAQIPIAEVGLPVDPYGSSKGSSHIAAREHIWSPESAAQSLSNRQQIDQQVHSGPVEVRSECSAPLRLSRSNHQPGALIDQDSPANSSRINRDE